MNKSTFSERPSLLEYEGSQVRINFDIEERTINIDADEEQTVYDAYVVRVRHPLTRSRVIDAIVSAKYPNDVMQAIINNRLIDEIGENEEHDAEFSEMQEWRAHAKEIAHQVLEALYNH